MVALGRVVVSRREYVVMLVAFDKGLLAATLRYSDEVRDHAAYFEDIPDLKLPAEMKQLAAHMVDTKASHFDSSKFIDHYENCDECDSSSNDAVWWRPYHGPEIGGECEERSRHCLCRPVAC